MMVTFVSQCEKKALKKTRRVLDAFADRIGDNTWQTVITEEGLNTVKKMLRQTASKSTAVSCHWIRSRSRSQFLWVVGNKNKFDERGVVPVNSTSNQIIIGDIEIMTDQIFANTKGQRLDQHLFAVGFLACKIIKRLVPNNENLAISAFIAGCWHDIGKIDPAFLNWLEALLKKNIEVDVPEDGQHIDKQTGQFSWQKHPRHNEISLLFFQLLFDPASVNSTVNDSINHAIYWHHAKPLRKNEIEKLVGIYDKLQKQKFDEKYNQFISTIAAIFKSIKNMAEEYFEDDPIPFESLKIPKLDDIEVLLYGKELPAYKSYTSRDSLTKYRSYTESNAFKNLTRSALITADRLVSQKFTGESLNERIANHTLENILDEVFQKDRGLKHNIEKCLDGFNQNNPEVDRNRAQAIAAKDLSDEEITIGVLRGPAGCGKTKIALEWALNTAAKRIFWVCPRVQICEGLFEDLQSKEYLSNAKVEICTGEIKQILDAGKPTKTPEGSEFSGDIVITTIDQVVNAITTHRNVTTLMDFMNSHVVFDEYHEYITMPAFNLLFAELVECKRYQQGDDKLPNTLWYRQPQTHYLLRNF
ncbi:CRISPR-associated endonuclease Cas3'' [uncultured Desulfuromusa sp.]|uniref:CRISPR-associated endonuclease Cas3'' n=1 Tax=uncultured Desulfuromusa sp. TaxID=219183 RepID=UPI002AA8E75E|nr:CRISPR-associated endonuclease Cas3'' [uncultured Desulfuromusa sp.]